MGGSVTVLEMMRSGSRPCPVFRWTIKVLDEIFNSAWLWGLGTWQSSIKAHFAALGLKGAMRNPPLCSEKLSSFLAGIGGAKKLEKWQWSYALECMKSTCPAVVDAWKTSLDFGCLSCSNSHRPHTFTLSIGNYLSGCFFLHLGNNTQSTRY